MLLQQLLLLLLLRGRRPVAAAQGCAEAVVLAWCALTPVLLPALRLPQRRGSSTKHGGAA